MSSTSNTSTNSNQNNNQDVQSSPFNAVPQMDAPTYPLVPHELTWHDHTRIDPFYWMRGEKLFKEEGKGEGGDEDDEEGSSNDDNSHHHEEEEASLTPPVTATKCDIIAKALTPQFAVSDDLIKSMLKAENAYTASYLPMTIRPDDELVAGRDTTPGSLGGSAMAANAISVARALSSQGSPVSPLLSRGGFPAACVENGFGTSAGSAPSSFPSLPITTGQRAAGASTIKGSAARREVAATLATPVSHLYKEMKSRWKQTDSTTPARGGAYWYYSREQKGKDYHQVCRRLINDGNKNLAMEVMRQRSNALSSSEVVDVNVPFCAEEEEVILDVNVLQQEMKLDFVDVMGPMPSPCDTKMIYAVDNSNGKEIFTLYVCDISPAILKAGLNKAFPPAGKGRGGGAAEGENVGVEPKLRFGGKTSKKETMSKKLKQEEEESASSSELSSDDDNDAETPSASSNSASSAPTHHSVRSNPPVIRTIELFDCTGDTSWLDSNIFAYTTLDDSQRSHRLILHDLRLPQEEHLQQHNGPTTTTTPKGGEGEGEAPSTTSASTHHSHHRHLNDVIIHEEKDARYSVGCVGYLDDERHATFGSSSKETEELYVIPNMPSTADMYRSRGKIFTRSVAAGEEDEDAHVAVSSSGKASQGKGKGRKTDRVGSTTKKIDPVLVAQEEKEERLLRKLTEALSAHSSTSEEAATIEFIKATHQGDDDVVVGRTIPQYQRAIKCMVPRRDDNGKETEMECEAAHHPYLFTPTRGNTSSFNLSLSGGFIFVANQKPKFSEFGVFYASDAEVLQSKSDSHIRNRWMQLVEVKQFVTVQSIEMVNDYLMLSCIDKGFPSCYVCSMDDVRRVIATQQQTTTTISPTYLRYGVELKCIGDFLLRMKKESKSIVSSSESGESMYCIGADWGTSDFIQCHTIAASVSHLSEKSQAYEINLAHLMKSMGGEGGGGATIPTTKTEEEIAYREVYAKSVEEENKELQSLGLMHPLTSDDAVAVVQTSMLRREEVMANGIRYDASLYASERLWVPALSSVANKDSKDTSPVLIPLTLTYRKDKYVAGESPILLNMYGSYGDCTDPEFNRNRLSIVDRGVAFGIVSVRGGGELGRGWRDAGRMANRLNSILDLVSVGQFLKDAPTTASWRPHPDKIAVMGGSAAGTIVAGAANRRPDLFCAVLADVPFVDCLTSMLDERIPLTTVEWEEWGNPVADPVAYKTILEYSPQDNVPGFSELVLAPQLKQMEKEEKEAEAEGEEGEEGGNKEEEELVVIKSAKRLWKAQPIPQSTTPLATTNNISLSPEVEAKIRSFPNLYVSSGLGDSRVAYWEPMAYVARVRATCRAYKAHVEAHHIASTTSKEEYHLPLVLHQCEMSGGHGGASGRFAYLKDIAREYAFLLLLWDIPLVEKK